MFGDARLKTRSDRSRYWWQGDPSTHRVPCHDYLTLCARRPAHRGSSSWLGFEEKHRTRTGGQVARAQRARRITQILTAPQHDPRRWVPGAAYLPCSSSFCLVDPSGHGPSPSQWMHISTHEMIRSRHIFSQNTSAQTSAVGLDSHLQPRDNPMVRGHSSLSSACSLGFHGTDADNEYMASVISSLGSPVPGLGWAPPLSYERFSSELPSISLFGPADSVPISAGILILARPLRWCLSS